MENRTWTEIDLNSLSHNFKQIRKITNKNSKILAVVKANAYGHGVCEIANELIQNGADYFGVACVSEAKQLRDSDIKAPILILGASFLDDCEDLVKYEIMPTVFSYDFAKELSTVASALKKSAKIHIKLDTGMSRIGLVADVDDENVCEDILKIAKLPYIEIDGIFSHFAAADEQDSSYTKLQLDRFIKICNMLEEKGLKIPIKHMANSSAIIMHPEAHFDMVRAGIILYGLYPSKNVDQHRLDLKPVMTLKSKITMVKTLEEGRGVSYGKTYITDKDTKIATVPIGYADGYTRLLSDKAKMIVGGETVDVIGRICMDQCMINVTNVNTINTGDEVIVFGADTITADSLAEWIGSINYEIPCMISMRVPRVYIKDGRAVKTLNYLNAK